MIDDAFISPHNLEAERAVLGAVLVRNAALDEVASIVQADDFFRDAHRRCFRHMLTLADRREAIDLVTLQESLSAAGELDAVDGPAYITKLVDGVPRTTNAVAYAGIVREKAIRRRLITACRRAIGNAVDGDQPIAALVDDTQRAVCGVGMGRGRGQLVDAATIVRGAFDVLEELASKPNGLTGVSTGFADLDRLTRGLQPTDLIILGARPAMGKTALALNIAAHTAAHAGPVAIFSFEMSKEQLLFRLAVAEAQVNLQRVLSGRTSEAEYPRLASALNTIAEWPLHIDDGGTATVFEIRSQCRRLHASAGLSLVVIDYLQLMTEGGRHDNRNLELSVISRGLKQLAKELRVPVLALSQFSREVDRRNGRPKLSDLRDSGALEQDADVVFLLWREEEYQATPQNVGLAEVIVAKHRNGPTGGISLRFVKEQTRFTNLERRTAPAHVS